MKKLNFLLLFMAFLAFSCSKDDLMYNEESDWYTDNELIKCTGPVIEVSPNGNDDTQNLIDAFALAKSRGNKAVVKLKAGEFHIGMIEVREFSGTLAGSGMGTTIITNLPDITPDAAVAENKLPALIKFIGGMVTLSDLSVQLSEGLEWLGTVDMSMLLFSDYSADFIPVKKHIGVTMHNIEVTGLLQEDVEGWWPGLMDRPYNNFKGAMLAPDVLSDVNPILRSNIDVCVSSSTFSNFMRGLYIHGCLGGNLNFGTNGGNKFYSNGQGLAVNENTGVHVKIENNEFNTPRYFGDCIDLNTGETVYYGWQQFEDAGVDPGTYEVRNNILNTKSVGIGMMDTWRWGHPGKPAWMKIIILNNTFNVSEGGAIMDFYCAKNVLFVSNTINGDGSMAGFWVENFWWEPTTEFNSSDGVKILNNKTSNVTIDFWFWGANNCLLMGDLSNFIINDYGENNKIIGKANYGHSSEKFSEQAAARRQGYLRQIISE